MVLKHIIARETDLWEHHVPLEKSKICSCSHELHQSYLAYKCFSQISIYYKTEENQDWKVNQGKQKAYGEK